VIAAWKIVRCTTARSAGLANFTPLTGKFAGMAGEVKAMAACRLGRRAAASRRKDSPSG
jgi:hypothetical protein